LYLDSLLPELEQEKPRIKHYSKEKLMKMLTLANEKDKMEKRKKDKKEKCKQKMYDNPKHKVQKQECMFFFLPVNPVFTHAAFPFRSRSRT
jgi:CRISPR/Cas system CSM-associated protein Csm4 (group 5 of RAMP superfamily)